MWGFVAFFIRTMINEYMQKALYEAVLAAQEGEVPVGAVIVKDGEVIASAHNLCEAEGSALKHAEVLAIERAEKALGEQRLDGCDLYVTLEPCAMCCGAISHARLSRVYFGAYDKIGGCVVSNMNCFDPPSPLRSIEYYCGIMEDECASVLTEFFKQLRHDGEY